jgi:hypothetical protein
MTEWWSYGLSDFLMFSPETYWRLVARHNAAGWPAQLLTGAVPAALLVVLRGGSATTARAVLVVLALAWAWLGHAFYGQRYTEIFLGAPWLAGACGVQSILLAATALLPLRRRDESPRPAVAALLLATALGYPLLAPLTGHPWNEAEVFAFMPDPTAWATLGALAGLLQVPGAARLALAVVPLLTLLLGALTRWLIA